MMTLTMRKNIQDRKVAFGLLVRFVRVARAKGLLEDYVAVPELQERGAYHFHLAVKGWQDVHGLRAVWWDVCGGQGQGNVDVQYRVKHSWSRQNLISYLCKYITKDFEKFGYEVKNKWRYRVSHSIRVVVQRLRLWVDDVDEAWSIIEEILVRLGGAAGRKWEGTGLYWNTLWAPSWK